MASPSHRRGATSEMQPNMRRGGRGRGRGDHMNGDRTDSDGQRGFGRGRGKGRGGRGGARDRAESRTATSTPGQIPVSAPAAEDLPDGQPKATQIEAPPDEDGTEICFICANNITHSCVAPCNHRTCHICSLRLRALYKTKACAHCRTEAATVIFTDESEKRYEEYQPTDFFKKDENLGISYEKPEIFEDTVLLLRYNCPDETCDVACMGWPDLHRHVRSAHQKVMCDLCTRNKKIFTHEHQLFTQNDLRKHEKFGDDNPGAVDQSGFKGHPECGFCRKRFYGDDELYTHCREKHERCHLCDRRTGGQNPQYYQNYDALERHFNKDHFMCLDSDCQEQKFVVFDSEMDLKAHQLEKHPNGLSKDARRDARRVDISSFDYRPQYQEERRGGRRGGGRGRDPNSEPMPASTGGHLNRAELAHQRAREIQSAQSVSTRTFGGSLTQSEPQAQTVNRPAHTQSPRPAAAQPSFPPLGGQTADASSRPAEALTPAEQARRLRHAAVTERAANLLGNDQTKLGEFRERISSFRQGTINAADLIDAFFSLFDTSSAELGKLIKELADIFEAATKRDALLKAWNDWKAINEDYPSLPGPTGTNATSAAGVLGAGIGSSRVLKLKSSTAQSNRSPMGQQRSWGSAGGAAAKTPAFPDLPSTNGASKPKASGWLALRPAAGSSASSSARPSPTPNRTQSSANLPKADAFPALPPGKAPTSTYFSPGYSGAGVIRPTSGTPVSAWGAGMGANGTANGGPVGGTGSAAIDGAGEAGKGKGKKGKQIMFKWG